MGQRLDNATSLCLEAVRDGNYVEANNTYAGARYSRHSTPVKDGKERFIEFFADFTERNPIGDIEIIRTSEAGQCSTILPPSMRKRVTLSALSYSW